MNSINYAIIVAAGNGTRFGGDVPKQFLEILGKPLIVHTLERFERCPQVNKIVLVLPIAEIADFRVNIEKYELKKIVSIVAGGSFRAESVRNGFRAVDAENAGVVAVHDGARPLVSIEEISQTIERAERSGAACLVAAVTDTIKEISVDKIAQTVDRARLRRALTPQCFRYEILKRAFEQSENLESATDESSLVERLGIAVSIVEGSSINIKITGPEDLILATSLLEKFQ